MMVKRSKRIPSFTGVTLLLVLLLAGGWHCKGKGDARQEVTLTDGDSTYVNETGKTRKIVLPDGSSALLSDHTHIRLAGGFNKERRELDLDGEAFFTVNADAGKPFVIHTRNLLIQVLGTRFRVDAYKKNAGEEVDLFSGRLKVMKTYHSDTDNEPETLQSGDMLMINRDIDLMEKEKMTPEELKKLDKE